MDSTILNKSEDLMHYSEPQYVLLHITLKDGPGAVVSHSLPPDELVVVGAELRLIEGSGRDIPMEDPDDATPAFPWMVGERVGRSAGEAMGVVYLGTALCRLSLLAVRACWFMRLREPGVASSFALTPFRVEEEEE